MRQPTRRLSDDRRKVVLDELAKLLAAGFIMEVLHPDWISNPVLVEKKKDEPAVVKVWRMCIDFTNLNTTDIPNNSIELLFDRHIK